METLANRITRHEMRLQRARLSGGLGAVFTQDLSWRYSDPFPVYQPGE